jgi:ubiquitin C-terminal hydrolase
MIDSTIPCTLDECLQEFTKSEIVHGVYCHACPIKSECESLKDDIRMLTEALCSLQARGHGSSETLTLQNEMQCLERRYQYLSSLNPDQDDTETDDDSQNNSNYEDVMRSPSPMKVDHEKKLMVTRLPPVLCFHVKRLHYNELSKMVKCSQHIIFSEYINVKNLCGDVQHRCYQNGENTLLENEKECIIPSIPYRLISVIEHRGNAFSGHYVTYRRAADQSLESVLPGTSSNWVYTSDEAISNVSWNVVKNCNAYMLIYEAV